MGKEVHTPKQIVNELNAAMAESDALDGDCKECQARRIGLVTDEEANLLGRNWNVDMVNGQCDGGCKEVLEQVANAIGEKYDADWPN